MDSEQARERVCLGVTELGELGCDVLHRAVALAQLDSGQRCALSHGAGGGGKTIGCQGGREHLGPRGDILVGGGELGGIPLLELGDALTGEGVHGLLAGLLCEEPQRRGGYVVVVAVHADVTGLGQDVRTSRTSPAPADGVGGFVLLDAALLDQQVEVAADRGRGQPQAGGEGCRSERAILGDRLPDPVPGARLKNVRRGLGTLRTIRNGVSADKHKNSVT